MRRTTALTPILLLVVLWGCSPGVALPDPLIEDPLEMAANLSTDKAPDSFLAEARIEFYADGKARKGKVLIMVEPPDKLRFEVLSFTDDLLALLVVNSEGFGYFERGAKACHAGRLCAAPQISQMPMASDPALLANLLLGKIPLLTNPAEQTVEFSTEDGTYHLVLKKGDHVQTVRVAPDGKRVVEASLELNGKTRYKITFEGSMNVDGRQVPRRLRLESPEDANDSDISVDYREFEFNVKFHGDPFEFRCPKGVDTRQWDCISQEEQ